jgi:hypothetical protein
MRNLYLQPINNGLGDQILDIIGITVVARMLGCTAHIDWCTRSDMRHAHGSGVYDISIFDSSFTHEIPNMRVHYQLDPDRRELCDFIQKINPSATLSPYSVNTWLRQRNEHIDIHELIFKYKQVAGMIKPSADIERQLPQTSCLSDTIAIHVRCTDKISDSDTVHVGVEEYKHNWRQILEMSRNHSSFFVCSEDSAMKAKMIEHIRLVNPIASFININYPPDDDISKSTIVAIDLFTMSRCKEIHQCTSYSTFSLLASLIGNAKLVNYSLNSPTLMHSWMPCCETIDMSTSFRFAHLQITNR